MPRRLLLSILILALAGSVLLQILHDRSRNYFAAKKVFITLPPGKTLKLISFGFDNLVADAIYIWAIQFYSTPQISNSYDYIEQVFNTITDLSPHSIDPYIIGAMIMESEARAPEMALRLFEKGIANLPQKWILYYEAGYLARKKLKDYNKAADFYRRAAQIPEAPPMFKRLQAHSIYLQDNLDEAWNLWMEIYNTSTEYQAKHSAYNHLFQIKTDRDLILIEQKIEEFKQLKGRLPIRLEELVSAKLLASLPVDFSGSAYEYDRQTAKVKPKRQFQWKKQF